MPERVVLYNITYNVYEPWVITNDEPFIHQLARNLKAYYSPFIPFMLTHIIELLEQSDTVVSFMPAYYDDSAYLNIKIYRDETEAEKQYRLKREEKAKISREKARIKAKEKAEKEKKVEYEREKKFYESLKKKFGD